LSHFRKIYFPFHGTKYEKKTKSVYALFCQKAIGKYKSSNFFPHFCTLILRFFYACLWSILSSSAPYTGGHFVACAMT